MGSLKVVSADSHMTEPADLWAERLDKKFRDNAPRVIKNEKPTGPAYLFVGPGIHPLAVAAAFGLFATKMRFRLTACGFLVGMLLIFPLADAFRARVLALPGAQRPTSAGGRA